MKTPLVKYLNERFRMSIPNWVVVVAFVVLVLIALD